ncbi:MAG: DUF4011 domain-containing protein [Planctomycetes bacterium]|nr:DUF4011 domain-containing protein [Planctomycetota bacterium]
MAATGNNSSKLLTVLSGRLVNITGKNRSIRLVRKTKTRCLDVAEIEPLRAGAASELLKAVMIDKPCKVLTYLDCPAGLRDSNFEPTVDEPAPLEEAEPPQFRKRRLFEKLNSTLVQLSRNAAAIAAETGATDLYFGYPWISGNCKDGTFLQAPVLLYPVQIRVERSPRLQWFVEPRDDAKPLFNEALALALDKFHETKLQEDLIQEAEDQGDNRSLGNNPSALITWFQERFAALGLGMKAPNIDVRPLPEFRTAEIPKATDGFTLAAHAIVGDFPQADSALRLDLEALAAMATSGALPEVLGRLLDNASPFDSDGDGKPTSMDSVPEGDTAWIIPSDASQERAMLRSRDERCMVIHGPPGTGKSQVICNLIADALANNERVLVCCQKRAALDVVFQRLNKEGLGAHLALVHDHGDDRQELYRRIAAALEPNDAASQKLGAEVDQLARSIDEATATLRDLAHELHRDRRCGMTARRLYAAATKISRPSNAELPRMAPQFDVPQLDRFAGVLTRLHSLHARLDKSGDAWLSRISFAKLGFAEQGRIADVLHRVTETAQTLLAAQRDFVGRPPSAALAERHLNLLERLAERVDKSENSLVELAHELRNPNTAGATKAALQALERITGASGKMPSRPEPQFNGGSVDVAATLDTYNERRGNIFRIFSGTWRRARNDARAYLKQEGLTDTAAVVSEQAAKIRAYHRWARLDKAVAGTVLGRLVNTVHDASALDEAVRQLRGALALAMDVIAAMESADGLQDDLARLTENLRQLALHAKKLVRLGQTFGNVKRTIADLAPYLPDDRLKLLTEKAAEDAGALLAHAEELKDGLAHFDTFVGIDESISSLRPVEVAAYRQLCESRADWIATFREAMIWGWLEEVENETRSLRKVATGEINDLQLRFRNELDKRRKLNALRLSYQLRQRATNRRFEPGKDVDGRHSAARPWDRLRDEVTKKRRIWPIRSLVRELRWPLLEVMPCWLVSPETLSAAFPLEEGLFDLAIFDEASQLAVEYGVPALFRAKRYVIAGDEKQLRPSDFFRGRTNHEQDDEAEDDKEEDKSAIEHESVLTLAKGRGFPNEMLSCHYRSKFQELIEFSNQGFYSGRLETMPSANGIGVAPIEWRKVSGIWENTRNKIEAAAVLDLVYELLKSGSRSSIGIITFNQDQRDEIKNQADSRSSKDPDFAALFHKAEHPPKMDDALFVKNIEHVQGDERDIIIFSIGYGPDPSGRILVNFASVNQKGGENRLNVAVSRARERIYVVSSVEPEDLDVAGTKNRGPALLRNYLEYAKAVSIGAIEQRDAVLRAINPDRGEHVPKTGHYDSEFEREVADALRSAGLTIVSQVGVSGYRIDLGILDPRNPTRYLLGVECDGATYHNAISARERDAYRQRFLESRGWKMHRIWSRNWWRDKTAEVRLVMDLIRNLQSDR